MARPPPETVCLLHGSNIGPLYVLKTPAREIEHLRGTYPIGQGDRIFADPHSPLVHTLLTFHDDPSSSLTIKTFTNVEDPDQRDFDQARANIWEVTSL